MPKAQSADGVIHNFPDGTVLASELEYQADPTRKAHSLAAGIGRFEGKVAPALPLALIPGLGATTVGAAAGSLMPVTEGNFASQKGKQIAEGAALANPGKLAELLHAFAHPGVVVTPAVAKVLAPAIRKVLDKLDKAAAGRPE